MIRLHVALVPFALAAACRPQVDEKTSLVDSPRVLAIRADPPEAAPNTPVSLTALWASPSEAASDAPIGWAFCSARKPLAELGPVSPACLARASDDLEPLGEGARVTASMPQKACRRFGPEVPEATKDEPPGRPVDPDSTGGYYQPVRVLAANAAGDAFTIGRVRLVCGVPGPSPEQLADLAAHSHPNTNPALDVVTANGTVIGEAAPLVVQRGQTARLRASWSTCAPQAVQCSGAESYAVYDVGTHEVSPRRESLRVSWFTTAGSYAFEHTGRDSADEAMFTENDWTAPSQAGGARMWLVVRDDRGGVGWTTFAIEVR